MSTPSGEFRRKLGWRTRLQLAAGGLILLGLAFLAADLYQRGVDLRQAITLIRGWGDEPWIAVAYVGAYALLTTLFAPATLLHLVSGAAWGFERAILFNLVACNVACNAHFLGARALGRARLRPLVARAGLEELDVRAARNGLGAVLFVRMIPLPMVVANAAVGVSAVRWRDFALGSFLGTLPVVFVYTYFASAIAQDSENAGREALWRSMLGGLLMAALALGTQRIRRRLQRGREHGTRNHP